MNDLLNRLGLRQQLSGSFATDWLRENNPNRLESRSPIDGALVAAVELTTDQSYEQVLAAAQECFTRWRLVPAPKRGEIIREVGEELRRHKSDLGHLITLEMGKILVEGEGEVQEAIDIADFAVGLSRQLYGLSMHSERPSHRMYEQWHPLGVIGVITAFNFPAAVWAWNAMIAAICGNSVLWKPSELTPVVAVALTTICNRVTARHGFPALFTLVTGDDPALGKRMAADHRLPLISATGSCGMGKSVAETVGRRLGRSLLELGGNNAIIVLADADLDLAVRAIVFGAVGTAGQRCTSTRRVLVERPLFEELTKRLIAAYRQVPIGNPLEKGTLMGPLINERAVQQYEKALAQALAEGAEILCGGKRCAEMPSSLYVQPTLVKASPTLPLLQQETFAPILYLIPVDSLEEAIQIQNDVPQGLSSAIFTNNIRASEQFLSAIGSDCGIANVNIGTSGAEIGGAFGGEKETGGGREAGSDSWKSYMRRQTNTINWSKDLPLAQGIVFDI